MNRVRSLSAVLCVSMLCAGAALAQQGKDKPATPPGEEEMMKKWQAFMTPGEGHKLLQSMAGTWDASMRMWMDPTKPPTDSKGSEVVETMLGGRYLKSTYSTTMMGMPMEGHSIMGFDNFRQKYFFVWIDNFGTGLTTAEGVMDRSGKVLTLYGKMDEPTTGERDKPIKYVYRFEGPDKHVFEIHDLTIGEPNTRVMEVTYTRKK